MKPERDHLRKYLEGVLFQASGGISDMAKAEVDDLMNLIEQQTKLAYTEGFIKGQLYEASDEERQALIMKDLKDFRASIKERSEG